MDNSRATRPTSVAAPGTGALRPETLVKGVSSNFIIATAGHVDHGKSSLVTALTGCDPDRLPEEKARGITIDLGFAHLPISTHSPDGSAVTLDIGIVDVPGHEDFVKNMVAGVGSIDLALFIVAADDGWMPQTEEHLQILSYLGVTRAVVVITKSDLVPDLSPVTVDIRNRLGATPFSNAPIVSTSVPTGRGLGDLKGAIASVLLDSPPNREIAKPRLPVDRVFTLRGIGTVVTGTLIGGTFRRGQAVTVQPGSRAAKVRSLQNHNRDVKTSPPGSRTAINLPDVQGSSAATAGIQRGEVVTIPELGTASMTLDVVVEKSARLIGVKTAAARPLKHGTTVRVHHGTANVAARINLLDVRHLDPGSHAIAQLRLDSPLFAFAGDHFIIRDSTEQNTLAGGIVLDADAERRGLRTAPRRAFLNARAQSPHDLAVLIQSILAREGAVKRAGLLGKSPFSTWEITEALHRAVAEKGALIHGEWAIDNDWWQAMANRAAGAIDAAHQRNPDREGLALIELRTTLEKHLPAPELFELLVAALCGNGFSQIGNSIKRATHRLALPPQLSAAGSKLRAALSAKPFDPPSRKEAAPDAASQQALRFLINSGEAIELSDEVVLLTEQFHRATGIICDHIRTRGAATASELRQTLGTSRRILIPLLERLDRDGVTRREGDKRVLNRN